MCLANGSSASESKVLVCLGAQHSEALSKPMIRKEGAQGEEAEGVSWSI